MALAINIRADNVSGEHIRALWRRAAAFEDEASMANLGYPPHISLAVYDEDTDEPLLARVLHEVFSGQQRFALAFDSVGYFDTTPMALWARPVEDPRLLSLQRHLHDIIGHDRARWLYRPENWVPHCSLATAVAEARREEAIAFCRLPLPPFSVIFDAADVVAFHPAVVIDQLALSG